MIVQRGDSGPQVEEIQRFLKSAGYDIEVDGVFGSQTDRAVRAFQRSQNLVADGRVGNKTRAAMQKADTSRLLHHSDIVRAAQTLGVEPALVLAVNEVESRGKGFLDDGRPIILFERHIMVRQVGERLDATILQRYAPAIVNKTTGGYAGGAAEHDKLYVAKLIDEAAAIESASWGQYQIMGFHWQLLGYASAQDFERAMHESEGNHLDAFVRFVMANPGMHAALKKRDFATFARLYNGPDYGKNQYDTKIAAAYKRHKEAA